MVVGALVAFFLIKRTMKCKQGDDPEKNEHLSPLASGKIKRKSVMTSPSKFIQHMIQVLFVVS